MATKTHTYEIVVGNGKIEGEISFNGSGKPEYSTEDPIDMPLKESKCINMLFQRLAELNRICGSIEKVEFNLKT